MNLKITNGNSPDLSLQDKISHSPRVNQVTGKISRSCNRTRDRFSRGVSTQSPLMKLLPSEMQKLAKNEPLTLQDKAALGVEAALLVASAAGGPLGIAGAILAINVIDRLL